MFAPRSLLCLSLLACLPAAVAETVEIETAKGRFSIENDTVTDLSGITWMGGDAFAAVSDKRNAIQLLTLAIDPNTGAVTGGRFGDIGLVGSKAGDFEGIVWDSAAKIFYLTAEQGNAVLRFTPGQPAARQLPVPAVFSKARANLSLESLTWSDGSRQFWISNEEALKSDGPVSSATAGTLVRLQKLDAKFRPVTQHAWHTEPAAFRYGNAGSGVSDLCLLPSGELIVLERGFAEGGLHLRLFLADFTGATDTTALPSLEGATFSAAGKALLYEETTGFINYEGVTLGPLLSGGWRSLILIADSNGTGLHNFLGLKVRWPQQSPPASETKAPPRRPDSNKEEGRKSSVAK